MFYILGFIILSILGFFHLKKCFLDININKFIAIMGAFFLSPVSIICIVTIPVYFISKPEEVNLSMIPVFCFFILIIISLTINSYKYRKFVKNYYYNSTHRKYEIIFLTKWRYFDETSYYEGKKDKRYFTAINPTVFISDELLAKTIKKYYPQEGELKTRYSHSTYHTEKKPIYRDEEYTVFKREYSIKENKYVNMPETKTRKIFDHYEDLKVEDKHYDFIPTIIEFSRIKNFLTNSFEEELNKLNSPKIEDKIKKKILLKWHKINPNILDEVKKTHKDLIGIIKSIS